MFCGFYAVLLLSATLRPPVCRTGLQCVSGFFLRLTSWGSSGGNGLFPRDAKAFAVGLRGCSRET